MGTETKLYYESNPGQLEEILRIDQQYRKGLSGPVSYTVHTKAHAYNLEADQLLKKLRAV